MRILRSSEGLLQDVRYGLRVMRKNLGFSVVAVMSLTVGIGANTLIFSLLNAVLLRSLPVQEPDRLVVLKVSKPEQQPESSFSYPLYRDLRDQNTVFSDVVAHNVVPVTITTEAQSDRATGELVSGNFFTTLGVKAAQGRLLNESDDVRQDGHPVAVLNYSFWQSRFGGAPQAVGQVIRINGFPFTIVGVAPKGFFGVEMGSSPDLWVPIMMQAQFMTGGPPGNMLERRTAYWLPIMARIKPGIHEQEAQSAAEVIYQQILQQEVQNLPAGHPLRGMLSGRHLELQPVSQGMSRLRVQFSRPLLVLMGMVAIVLLAACVNLANLLLARAAGRRQEIAIRLSIGASRSRIIRQLLTESMLLSVIGGALGLAFAYQSGEAVLAFLPQSTIPLTVQLHTDVRVLIFTLAISVVTGVVFGLIPALQATRSDLTSALKNEPAKAKGGRRLQLTSGLVIGQVALSLLLLASSALLVRSLQNLRSMDSGYNPKNVLTASLDVGLNGYNATKARVFYDDLLTRVGNLPGASVVSLANGGPLSRMRTIKGVSLEGYPPQPGQQPGTIVTHIMPHFFDAVGMLLLAGRDITGEDRDGTPKVAVVNDTFAQRYLGDGEPLGKHIGLGGEGTPPDTEIVGVVRSAKDRSLRDEVSPTVYLPFLQSPDTMGARILYARTTKDPSTLLGSVRHEVSDIDPNLPVLNVRTLSQQVDDSLVQDRMMATLASFFGLMALVLALVGVYGVMSYRVAQRTRELGIRLALGAERGQVVWLVLRSALGIVFAGIALGLPMAIAASRLVKSYLFGLTPNDPLTFAVMTVLLAAVAIVAGYLPARRAARVDPVIALRSQ
jgi:putative ABC transport system permease protein